MKTSYWCLLITRESQADFIGTSSAERSKRHIDFSAESPNDGYLGLKMRRMKYITFWITLMTVTLRDLTDHLWHENDVRSTNCAVGDSTYFLYLIFISHYFEHSQLIKLAIIFLYQCRKHNLMSSFFFRESHVKSFAYIYCCILHFSIICSK